jgi:uncharacterized membrane protein
MLTLVTYAIGLVLDNVNFTITFGVLHCIALALILVGIHEKFGTNKWSYLIIGLVMLCLGIIIENIGPTRMSYNNNDFFDLLIKQMIGLVECGQDSFAFFLNGGQIYLGVFLGKLLYGQKKSLFTRIPKLQNMKYHNNVVTFLGRNSLLAYFASQIIFPLLIGIVLLMCGYTLAF